MTTKTCIGCNNMFIPNANSQKFCNVKCRSSSWKKKEHWKLPSSKLSNRKSRLNTFGLSLNDYQDMLEKQGGTCAICGSPETQLRYGTLSRLAVDHCHITGTVRGLLCSKCNLGLGKFKDNWVLVENAMEYLQSSDCRNGIFARWGTR